MEMFEVPLSDWNRTHAKAGILESPSDPRLSHVSADIPPDLLRLAMNMQSTRDERRKYFDPHLFGEAGWDMLLATYIAHGRRYQLKVSDACYESRVPVSTALRWLEHIERAGLVERRQNTVDRRSLLVSITREGIAKMNDYLRAAATTMSRV